MNHHDIKKALHASIAYICDNISNYAIRPERDFIRNRCLPPKVLLFFMIQQRVKSSTNELIDFFSDCVQDVRKTPTVSALVQAKQKLKPEAMYDLWQNFNSQFPPEQNNRFPELEILLTDGTGIGFPYSPRLDKKWLKKTKEGKTRGQAHLTAVFGAADKRFRDGVLHPVHEKDEHRALCTLIDRNTSRSKLLPLYIVDRGFPSWNTIAHAMEAGCFFLMRTKDMDVKPGLLWPLDLPRSQKTFDVWVKVVICRQPNRENALQCDCRRIHISKNRPFDYLDPDSDEEYVMVFRVARFQLPNGEYESVVTNLPDRYTTDDLLLLYGIRWLQEVNFNLAKSVVGIETLTSVKPQLWEQELWAKLIAFNFISAIKALADAQIRQEGKKYAEEARFSSAANLCCRFLAKAHCWADLDQGDVLLQLISASKYPKRQKTEKSRGKPAQRNVGNRNHRAA